MLEREVLKRGTVNLFGKMEMFMRDFGKMEEWREEGILLIMMVVLIRVYLRTIISMQIMVRF
jgi:hypothetical protein